MSAPGGPPSVCLVNGSLRGQKASSFHFLSRLERNLHAAEIVSTQVSVRARPRQGYSEDTLATLDRADVLILAFPLYAYCLPGGFMRLLEEWARHAHDGPARKPQRVYAIVNCGFVSPDTNAEAIRVVKHFCARLGLRWRFALLIACGPAVIATESVDLRLRRAMRRIVADIQSDTCEPADDVPIKPLLPRIIMDTVRERLDRNSLRELLAAGAQLPSASSAAGAGLGIEQALQLASQARELPSRSPLPPDNREPRPPCLPSPRPPRVGPDQA